MTKSELKYKSSNQIESRIQNRYPLAPPLVYSNWNGQKVAAAI